MTIFRGQCLEKRLIPTKLDHLIRRFLNSTNLSDIFSSTCRDCGRLIRVDVNLLEPLYIGCLIVRLIPCYLHLCLEWLVALAISTIGSFIINWGTTWCVGIFFSDDPACSWGIFYGKIPFWKRFLCAVLVLFLSLKMRSLWSGLGTEMWLLTRIVLCYRRINYFLHGGASCTWRIHVQRNGSFCVLQVSSQTQPMPATLQFTTQLSRTKLV